VEKSDDLAAMDGVGCLLRYRPDLQKLLISVIGRLRSH